MSSERMHLVTACHISISKVALCQMGAVSISVAWVAETGGRVYYPSLPPACLIFHQLRTSLQFSLTCNRSATRHL